MKIKICLLGAFFVIFMFLTNNMSWAHDPIPRSRAPKSYADDRGKSGGVLTQRGFIHLNKEQRRFERARRQAWADGKLTYMEMRRLHQIRKRGGKDIKRHKHPYRFDNRRYINYKDKRPTFPRFTIDFSFSKPWLR